MLHALHLGLFRYTHDRFFEQIGETGQLADDINGLSREIGWLMSRQSDRDFPITRFANGVRKGKLMVQEYPGILLCIAATLRCTQGRNLLAQKKTNFGTDHAIRDWSQLVETLLQWERWLKSPQMEKKHVKASREKHRYIMYLAKNVAKRAKGMQLKLTKFHTIVHIAEDILNFGVPMEVDTGANESGHKSTKKAALLTQRNEATFEKQTAERLDEMHLIELAEQEIAGKHLWDYGEKSNDTSTNSKKDVEDTVGGGKFYISFDTINDKYLVKLVSSSCDETDEKLELDLIKYVFNLQEAVQLYINTVPLQTLYKRQGQIFRGHNKFRGDVWRDWALFNWGQEGELPNKIWGFVDLRGIPEGVVVNYARVRVERGIYAVVENAIFTEDATEVGKSEIFRPIEKEIGQWSDDMVSGFRFYLADVEAIVRPLAVIPDIGGPTNRYFLVKDRDTWRQDFIRFLEGSDVVPRRAGSSGSDSS